MDALQYHKEELFEGYSLFSLILVVLIAFATSLTIEVNLLFALIGFFPSILTIILAILIFEESKTGVVVTWFVPFLVAGVFFLLSTNQALLASNLDVISLVIINLAICLIYLSVLHFLLKVLDKQY